MFYTNVDLIQGTLLQAKKQDCATFQCLYIIIL